LGCEKEKEKGGNEVYRIWKLVSRGRGIKGFDAYGQVYLGCTAWPKRENRRNVKDEHGLEESTRNPGRAGEKLSRKAERKRLERGRKRLEKKEGARWGRPGDKELTCASTWDARGNRTEVGLLLQGNNGESELIKEGAHSVGNNMKRIEAERNNQLRRGKGTQDRGKVRDNNKEQENFAGSSHKGQDGKLGQIRQIKEKTPARPAKEKEKKAELRRPYMVVWVRMWNGVPEYIFLVWQGGAGRLSPKRRER